MLPDGTSSNRLYLLRKLGQGNNRALAITGGLSEVEKGVYEWEEPFTIGKPPPPRFGHSMTLLRPVLSSKSYLVVYGGRNDTRECQGLSSKTAHGGVRCLDDLWVLDLTPLLLKGEPGRGADYLFLQALG